MKIFAHPISYIISMKTTFKNSYIITIDNITRQTVPTFNNSYGKKVLPLTCSVAKVKYILSPNFMFQFSIHFVQISNTKSTGNLVPVQLIFNKFIIAKFLNPSTLSPNYTLTCT